jgi:hypothetical protein
VSKRAAVLRRARERRQSAQARGRKTNVRVGVAPARERIGPPNQKKHRNGMKYWTYLPAPADPQTVTQIMFDARGWLCDIERTIRRWSALHRWKEKGPASLRGLLV